MMGSVDTRDIPDIRDKLVYVVFAVLVAYANQILFLLLYKEGKKIILNFLPGKKKK